MPKWGAETRAPSRQKKGCDSPSCMRERGRSPFPELPPALREHFRTVEMGAMTTETNLGTVLVAKMPIVEAACIVGDVPIGIDHELYARPSAPVIRMVTAFYDRP